MNIRGKKNYAFTIMSPNSINDSAIRISRLASLKLFS